MHDAADCEDAAEGYLAQDVNAWSSLGYVAASAAIVGLIHRRQVPPAFAALAAVIALEGLGSFLFHGVPSDVAQLLHDAPLLGTLGFVAGWHAGRLGGRPERMAVGALVVATATGGVLWAFAPSRTDVAAGLLVVVAVGASAVARRRRLPAVWDRPLLALAALAVLAWFAGTTDSPLCDGGSLLQPHALWHLLTAALVLVWVDRATAALTPARPPGLLRRPTDQVLAGLSMVTRRCRGGTARRSHRR